ncbi:uncharacterized protein LOC123510246 isoform X2 [Portunus trituberculatus]|uniref:uncharacterized protein LOC123510246 isoform X2 n=1 Tax=Portunus trituberculatus TaxID=210409 RepID=UPI001E1CF40B|nr:uncharacterized protein LOC123510246 isoform X2 [Portunus trituberculatus]
MRKISRRAAGVAWVTCVLASLACGAAAAATVLPQDGHQDKIMDTGSQLNTSETPGSNSTEGSYNDVLPHESRHQGVVPQWNSITSLQQIHKLNLEMKSEQKKEE